MAQTILHQILERSDFSPRTKDKYENMIDRWVTFAGTDPAGWTRERAEDFYAFLLNSGVKIQSANVYIASLRYVSSWYAKRMSRPDLDFAIVQVRRGTEDSKEPRLLSQIEATKLILACGQPDAVITPVDRRDRTLIIVGLETGMRRMSLGALSIESLNETPGYPAAKVPVKGPGGRSTFQIPLSDIAMLILRDWLAWLRTVNVKRGAVFVRLQKRIVKGGIAYIPEDAISTTMIHNIVTERALIAGIGHVHPHLFRHAFSTWRTLQGLSPLEIAAMLGHKVPGMGGGAARYVNMTAVAERVRNSTPPWLAALVEQLLRKP